MEIESILSKVGRLGKFQILMYIFCGLQGISFPVWDMLSVTSFMAPTPDYACRIEIIDEDNQPQVKYAALNSSSMSTGACEEGELVFNLDTYGRTMVTEWQLVGEKAMFVELSQSLFMVGMMLGSVVLGQMSDMFGRRPVLIISATLSPLMSVASGFVPNIFVFTGLRIMIGFICPGAILTSYVLALELFPACRRAAASILLSSFNGIGYVGLAVLAYYIKDWRNLQIATGAIRCGLIPLCLFVPESIQWLAAKGKHQKLEKLLQRIAKINKIDIAFPILETKTDITATQPPDTEEELYAPIINEETTEKGKSMEDLFMYDSALSLDRDYIPDEDQYSTNTYSSESETEEPVQPLTSSSRTRFPSALFQQDRVFPGHCQQVSTGNLCRVNSSISILSELQKGCEQYESYETLKKPEFDLSIAVSVMPVGKPSQKKPQRKKSVSMCHLPNIVAFISETETSDSPSSSSESGETVKFAGLLRTTSIPNITKNPSVEALDRQIHVDSVAQQSSALTRAHKRPPHLTIQPNEGMGSSFLLSVPTLALPFGYSQNMFPNIGVQYENIESSQSEESLHDYSDTSGFNSSTTNMDRLTDYEALEAGYSFNTTPQQKGYSEIKTSSDEPPKPKKIRKGYNALDLFRKSSVRLVTIVSMIMWFATYSVYVGLSMSTDELAGDPYINFSLVGLVEIPAVIVAAFSAVRIGRRYPSGVFHFLAALSCCVFLMIPSDSASSWTPLVSVVAILSAKCFTSAAYNVECLLTAEVLPTPLRTVGIGMFVLCSRIGGVIVPFILLTGESWNKYPMMIFAALSVLSSLMLLPLPEMIGMPQPQTPDDIKKIRKISKERRNSKVKPPVSFV